MQIIRHRTNKISDLQNISNDEGAEIDIRYHEEKIIIQHDPFPANSASTITLEEFLKSWKSQGTLILNLKSEGIEKKCISILKRFNLSNWFFLDMSMPYFVRFSFIAKNNLIDGFNPSNLAVRFSDAEPIEYALAFIGKAEWVWIDTFNKFPLSKVKYNQLKKNNFKICIVSPELHGHNKNNIAKLKKKLAGMTIDAVCTKYPSCWR
jgi:hypothetical protein